MFGSKIYRDDIDGLVEDCSNSSALAMELLQSCTKPPTWQHMDLGHQQS